MEHYKLKVKRITPYGIELEDKTFLNTTKQVRDFLKNNVPCEVEAVEVKGKTITRVKVLSKDFKPSPVQEVRPKVDAGNTLSLAVNIYLSQKDLPTSMISHFKNLHEICEELVKEFKYLEEALK